MPSIKEKLIGKYEVSYIRTTCSKPQTDIFRRIELKGPPFICLCYKKAGGVYPDLVIPLEKTLSIHEVARDARGTSEFGRHALA